MLVLITVYYTKPYRGWFLILAMHFTLLLLHMTESNKFMEREQSVIQC